MGRLHWYCFTYKGKVIECGSPADASTYKGYEAKDFITLKMIKDNKRKAGLTDSACLINITYLGYMTKQEFIYDQ